MIDKYIEKELGTHPYKKKNKLSWGFCPQPLPVCSDTIERNKLIFLFWEFVQSEQKTNFGV